MKNWKPEDKWSMEDRLLATYFNQLGGLIFIEVLVGKGGLRKYPVGAKPRRIDAVRFPLSNRREIVAFGRRKNSEEFEKAVSGAKIEVIEVKRNLNRVVIGQVLVGADLMEMEYQPASIHPVIICAVGDPVLELVCQKRGIRSMEAIGEILLI